MTYEWDPKKALSNLNKHGIDFADAAFVLEDPLALTREDPDSEMERRSVTVGVDVYDRTLVVVWARRRESIRLISARRATPAERRRYEET